MSRNRRPHQGITFKSKEQYWMEKQQRQMIRDHQRRATRSAGMNPGLVQLSQAAMSRTGRGRGR